MENEKIVFNVGLCNGRHEMPVSEYIFQEIENPCDVGIIEKNALDWVNDKFIVSVIETLENKGLQEADFNDCKIELNIYVTGLTICLTSVLKALMLFSMLLFKSALFEGVTDRRNYNLDSDFFTINLMHYNTKTGEYVPQKFI